MQEYIDLSFYLPFRLLVFFLMQQIFFVFVTATLVKRFAESVLSSEIQAACKLQPHLKHGPAHSQGTRGERAARRCRVFERARYGRSLHHFWVHLTGLNQFCDPGLTEREEMQRNSWVWGEHSRLYHSVLCSLLT